MNSIKVGVSQNEFYKIVAGMCKPTGIFKDVLLGEEDDKLFLIFIPAVLYEDVVKKYSLDNTRDDSEDLRYLLPMPNEDELTNKNFFFGIAKNMFLHIVRKVIGDGRTEYISNVAAPVLEKEE